MRNEARPDDRAFGFSPMAGIGPEHLSALGSANVSAFIECSEALLKGMAEFNEELVRLGTRHVESSRAVARCETWSDMVALQTSLTRDATSQYLLHTAKLAEIAVSVATASWGPFQTLLAGQEVQKASRAPMK